MRTVRSVAMTVTLGAGGVLALVAGPGNAVSSLSRSPTKAVGEKQAPALEVTEDYPTIQTAIASLGVSMTSNRQVVLVMAYPTFVDTRVIATEGPRDIVGARMTTTGIRPNATGNRPLVWTPSFPNFTGAGVGQRFVSSRAGSITIEVRESPTSPWHRYVATSTAMRWTAGRAL